MTIKSILFIPKDQLSLDYNEENHFFTPPQAYDAGHDTWILYNPYVRPPYGSLHTFALILYWEGKPCYAGLDYFCRYITNGGRGWEWPLGKCEIDTSPEAIIGKVKTAGMFENSYGELVIIEEA